MVHLLPLYQVLYTDSQIVVNKIISGNLLDSNQNSRLVSDFKTANIYFTSVRIHEKIESDIYQIY